MVTSTMTEDNDPVTEYLDMVKGTTGLTEDAMRELEFIVRIAYNGGYRECYLKLVKPYLDKAIADNT